MVVNMVILLVIAQIFLTQLPLECIFRCTIDVVSPDQHFLSWANSKKNLTTLSVSVYTFFILTGIHSFSSWDKALHG